MEGLVILLVCLLIFLMVALKNTTQRINYLLEVIRTINNQEKREDKDLTHEKHKE
jgi:hypothetical protein